MTGGVLVNVLTDFQIIEEKNFFSRKILIPKKRDTSSELVNVVQHCDVGKRINFGISCIRQKVARVFSGHPVISHFPFFSITHTYSERGSGIFKMEDNTDDLQGRFRRKASLFGTLVVAGQRPHIGVTQSY